ncbi:shikimate dehydrogenase [Clostridium sp. P21]|uniref:Shikimate dehydrogenase (NADP(+)) n=1 Tax=Clostridium muellerianum TaxID=2716538 RepID=A0A7Y0HP38_9CLOT|nr:shikimate dehydrogenase [Clostridium muellerianum]NMM63825.1 shikimate dehydrogenase [Clostridium muellerianum]
MSSLYGLIGERLGHSLSPEIHSLILEKLNLKGLYNLFEVNNDDLKEAVIGLKALGAKGVNVTIPYKVEIMQYLDSISKEAEKIGAVNTIAFKENGIIGYNTDYYGFGESLKNGKIDIYNKNAVILGTGGASKAVLHYLLDNGVKDVVYVSRNPENAMKQVKNFNIISYEDMNKLKNTDIIINCTPCGMYPKVEYSPVNRSILSKFSSAVDLIYNPKETIFLKEARETGAKTVNGLYMLVAQAAASQEIWQERKISEEIIKQIYEKM